MFSYSFQILIYYKMDNGGHQQQQRQPHRPAGPVDDDDDNNSYSSSSDDAHSTDFEFGVEDNVRSMVFSVVGTRPQFQVVRRTLIREEGPRLPPLYRVEYRSGRIIEGTLAFINRDLGDRIAAASDGLLRDHTIDWESLYRRLRQQQQQQQQQNGH
jgi:hypothetical protein